jgi:formate-dependent nitrite reductase membrane component NrfD
VRGAKDPTGKGDGRYIDPAVGDLTGEAAQQVVLDRRGGREVSMPFTAWDEMPARGPEAREGSTYYDRPVIKEPVWIWAVPAYFYAGGAAGAAAVLGAATQTLDREGRLRGLVIRCRRIAALGTVAGAGLLVYDLGRPKRFLNMLRVFRPTSAMSMGSWILAAAGSMTTGSALLAGGGPAARRAGDAAGLAAGLVGVPLAGYTGVLLSDTAVPLWQEGRRILPPLFAASAISSAGSLLMMSSLDHQEERVVERFDMTGKAAELAGMLALDRKLSREDLAECLKRGVAGSLWKVAKLLTVLSLGLSLAPGAARIKKAAAGLMGTAATVGLRFAVFYAGKASARAPRATFRQQREGHGGAEATGVPAIAASDGGRAVR